jgi:hypothetical protein
MLPGTQIIWRRMVKRDQNDRMWKDVLVTYFKISPQHIYSCRGWRKQREIPIRTPSVQVEIRTKHSWTQVQRFTAWVNLSRLIHRAITTRRNGSDLLVRFVLFKIVYSSGDDRSVFIKGWEFLDYLNNCKLLMSDYWEMFLLQYMA